MTMKQAGLISVTILNKLIHDAYMERAIIITPLAGVIFSKDDLRKMAKELKVRPYDLIRHINASCQSGGQHLPDSQGYLAVVSSVCSTRNMRKEEARVLAVGRTIKQYLHAKKLIDTDKIKIACKYTFGGVPLGFEPSKILKMYNDIKTSAAQEAKLTIKEGIAEEFNGANFADPWDNDENDDDDKGKKDDGDDDNNGGGGGVMINDSGKQNSAGKEGDDNKGRKQQKDEHKRCK